MGRGAWILLALLPAMAWCGCGRAQIAGFLSIDCGSQSAANYEDKNGIAWLPEGSLMTEGKAAKVPAPTGEADTTVLSTLRYFPGNQTKYCYTLAAGSVTAGHVYLVRASFWIGSAPPYPTLASDSTSFRLLIDADVWANITFTLPQTSWYFHEMYVQAQRDSIDVCLARTGPSGDPPFISAIELRPLGVSFSSAYIVNATGRPLQTVQRYDYGVAATESQNFRYPADVYDRIWVADKGGPALATASSIASPTTKYADEPPKKAMQTAYVSQWPGGFTFNYSALEKRVYFVVLYFAEIDEAVNATGQRVFSVAINGQYSAVGDTPYDVYYNASGADAAMEAFFAVSTEAAQPFLLYNFTTLTPSLYPPFVSAAEVFLEFETALSPGTLPNDVLAIDDIKASMALGSYTGDPCLPLDHSFPWLTCSADTPPRIREIILSHYNLKGVIPSTINTLTDLVQVFLNGNNLEGPIPDLSGLTSLETLDLSNNKLNGSIPESLASLKNLKYLYIQNNNFEGEVPPALLQSTTLKVDYSCNPLLSGSSTSACDTTGSSGSGGTNVDGPSPSPSSQSKSKLNTGLIAGLSIVGVLVVGVGIGVALFCVCRKKPKAALAQAQQINPAAPQVNLAAGQEYAQVVPNPSSVQRFTFPEIKAATSNFSTQLGIGGFGPVFKGTLKDGHLVAIKVSANSSRQGSKEFLNEVDLLSRVHHKHLVALIGYCTEEKLTLVYEFMSKGSLFDCLHGQYAKATPLSWDTRLKILVDAAQGLDYLHGGCDPNIIHRDVKSSNILLNEKLEAKISDFGISRNTFGDRNASQTTALMGSMGYVDPEYLVKMRLTEKVDVYSFGVMLFEVVCGRMAIFTDPTNNQAHNLVEWARSPMGCGDIDAIVDSSLHSRYDVSSVWKVLETAIKCVQYESMLRPRMNEVFLELRDAHEMHVAETTEFDKPSLEFNGGDANALHGTHHLHAR